MTNLKVEDLEVGGYYKFLFDQDLLVYLGVSGSWYQFAKAGETEVWAEVIWSDLRLLWRV